MYSICKISHPATGVEHALTCNFFNEHVKNVVVASANVLRVYQLIPDVDLSKKNASWISSNTAPKMKMECLAQYTLYASVANMQSITFAGSSRDSLLLAFNEAKMSIVEYNPDMHDLTTLYMHFFEQNTLKDGWCCNIQEPIVRVDPENRCAVMLIYGRKLVVLPFQANLQLDDNNIIDLDAEPADTHKSYILPLKDIDEGINNIIDIQFLHGYYQPTIMILYEPVKTFPGRLAMRKDTCCMLAISLNTQQQVHPVVWSVVKLPFDCFEAVPVQKPLGGVLILAANSIIYLNQSIPPYGVALNSLAISTTNFPLKKPPSGLCLTLDRSHCTFISNDKLVLSAKSGDIYVISIRSDSIRAISSFNFEKCISSVLSSCICLIDESYLFVGSRLGNSVLLKFYIAYGDDGTTHLDEKGSAKKRLKKKWVAANLPVFAPSDMDEVVDMEELEVYESDMSRPLMKKAECHVFEICDSLLNIGPCGQMVLGEPAFLSEDFGNKPDPDLELVVTSGHDKNGALCVLQQTVRPNVITSFKLPGYTNMWTVVGSQAANDQHAYLIISRPESSMILQTGREINEIDHPGFYTEGCTIFSGNIGKNKFILQVVKKGVRLVQGSEEVQRIPLDLGSPLSFVSMADPHAICLTEDKQLIFLTLKEVKVDVWRIMVQRPTNFQLEPRLTSACLYCDESGLFSSSIPEHERRFHGLKREKNLLAAMKGGNTEDMDELLYGEAGPETDMMAQSAFELLSSQYRNAAWWKKYIEQIKKTFWLMVTRSDGKFEIYSIPDFTVCYTVPNITDNLLVLHDNMGPMEKKTGEEEVVDDAVEEMIAVGLGHGGRRPVLLMRTKKEIMVYTAFRYSRGLLKVRFRKVRNILMPTVEEMPDPDADVIPRFRYFNNVANYDGIFVCGENPQWIFMTARGELRVHAMLVDGPARCFATFHNINCPRGFLYFNALGDLRICSLPKHVTYDAAWPMRKVPLKKSARFVSYHAETKTYALVTTECRETNQVFRFNGEDKEMFTEERDEQFPLPQLAKYSVQLFSPVTWQVIPGTNYDLQDWEYATCFKNVMLAYEGTRSGLKGYICVGTNYNYCEEVTNRGRILIFDIIEVVPEPGQPLTKNKMKAIYAKEQKGPITAISNTKSGYLITAVGQKIYVWQLKDDDLSGIAFMDIYIYAHDILTCKDLILVADVYKSIALLRFQQDYRTLSLVSRDFKSVEVYAINLVIDGPKVGFLTSDRNGNFVIYRYNPEDRESLAGSALVKKADYHLGQCVNSFCRVSCTKGFLNMGRRKALGSDLKQTTYFSTLDGAVGYILPVNEKIYRRLLTLQKTLVLEYNHLAGLNPKMCRSYKTTFTSVQKNARSIVDADFVSLFLNLRNCERRTIARKIGIKVEFLLEDLYALDMLTTHF